MLNQFLTNAWKQCNWGEIAFLATCAGAIGHSQVKKKKKKQETNKTKKPWPKCPIL